MRTVSLAIPFRAWVAYCPACKSANAIEKFAASWSCDRCGSDFDIAWEDEMEAGLRQ